MYQIFFFWPLIILFIIFWLSEMKNPEPPSEIVETSDIDFHKMGLKTILVPTLRTLVFGWKEIIEL